MDWETFLENIGVWYNTFVEWYLQQPLYGQVLAIIGIVALLALLITLIYYLVKGIAYLVYYIIKGIFYLLKYIGYGIFKLFQGFYLIVSGESKSKTKNYNQISHQNNSIKEPIVFIAYCSECGKKVTNKMKYHLETHEIVFCVNCGTRLRRNQATQPYIISH
ncbi:MAG: hypothetical protein ACFFDF_19140 [Candidatus Odinarchaeota archaeon]